MGDPRKIRKKYQTPRHPWQKARIEEEKKILEEYGIKNKKEIWKMESRLRDFADRAKKLITARTVQTEKEKKELLVKLRSLGLISAEAGLDYVLGLTLRDILERRLQTLVYKKNLAKSMSQARQFIVHGHIKVGERKISAPSYLVNVNEEGLITFSNRSSLNDPEHPERVIQSESDVKKKLKKKEEKGTEGKEKGSSKKEMGNEKKKEEVKVGKKKEEIKEKKQESKK